MTNRPNKTAQLQRAISQQGHPHRVTWDNDAGYWATAPVGAVYLGHGYKDAAMVVAIGAIEQHGAIDLGYDPDEEEARSEDLCRTFMGMDDDEP